MPISMSKVREQLAAEKQRLQAGRNGQLFNITSQMPYNTNALVRVLPHRNEDMVPYETKWNITLRFGGMVNSDNDHDNEVRCIVPSMKTWGMDDYIIKTTSPYWRGTKDEQDNIARPYYHRPTHYVGCLVVSLPFTEDDPPENPVRVIGMTRQLFGPFLAGLNNPDLEWAPWDYDQGRDFRITKTQQGGFPNYTTSQWSYRERALSDVERAAVDTHGLPDLTALIGPPPSDEQRAIIKEMFHASLAGEPYDNKRWGQHFRAFGSNVKSDQPTTQRGGNGSKAESTTEDVETEALLAKLHARVQSTRKSEDEAA